MTRLRGCSRVVVKADGELEMAAERIEQLLAQNAGG